MYITCAKKNKTKLIYKRKVIYITSPIQRSNIDITYAKEAKKIYIKLMYITCAKKNKTKIIYKRKSPNKYVFCRVTDFLFIRKSPILSIRL